MRVSTDRILTTHVGSLPRPQPVVDVLFAQDNDEDVTDTFNTVMRAAVDDAVTQQFEAGVDLPSDGEMSKISYATYVRHRLAGFDRFSEEPRPQPQDLSDFPEFLRRQLDSGARPIIRRPVCSGPVTHRDIGPMRRDLANLTAAIDGRDVEPFMNAASPGVIAAFQPNEYYPSHEEYLSALVEAMKPEYEAVNDAGIVLQVDCPDLAMARHMNFAEMTDDEFLRIADLHIDALNASLANVPAEQVRIHICWGNYEGPHTRDIPLSKVVQTVLRANAQAFLFESANPRHAHEANAWREASLPDDKVLVPGVIDTTSNFVEHPELVAQRVCTYAEIVGRDRVIAGTDCGFGTFAGFGSVHPSVCCAKLKALSEGAALASERLW
jgi:5-methyltetrahydropteroyltriglutamate--homocysteine methyltransferase